ncbi:MAG: hypothetical protein ACJZ62_02650 [Candidatus Pelagibacterales bacterium]|mgnify:FL=1
MYKNLLNFLRVGVISNLILLWGTFTYLDATDNLWILVPAQFLLLISAYRCMFPVNYASKAVLFDSILSSVFITRFLVTIVEVTYIFMFSHVLRIINDEEYMFVTVLSWLMVIQVTISQFFCWGAILIKYERFYFYEELGWFIIFLLNSICSIILLNSNISSDHNVLIILNIIFGILYLPWQVFHLKSILDRIKGNNDIQNQSMQFNIEKMKIELNNAFHERKVSYEQSDWGRVVGIMWMYGYWILIIPIWVFYIVRVI